MIPAQPRPNLPALTSLRFFAAFVVVAFHYNPARLVNLPGFFQAWLETGYEAVTFFFVLSGFIMSYTYSDYGEVERRRPGRSFFAARFARLAPAYYLSLLISAPIFVLDSFVWNDEPVGLVVSQSVLVSTFLQSWWPPAALAWNPPGWSVSVEWGLYALLPLLLTLSRRWSGTAMLLVSFSALAAMSAFRLWIMRPLVDDDREIWHNFAQYFPLFHVPTFFFGMALGRLQVSGPRPSRSLAGAMCLVSLLTLMLKFSGDFELAPILETDLVHATLFGLLILGAAQPGHLGSLLLMGPPTIYLGEISYAIYILHEPVMMWWEVLWPADETQTLPIWLQFPLYFATVVAASAACHRWVEGPLRRRLRRWLER